MNDKTKKKSKEFNISNELSVIEGKTPPQSIEFEKLVIGSLLIDKKAIDHVIFLFGNNAEIFYDPKHILIYEAIHSLVNRKNPVDMMTVIMELRRNENLSAAGGDEYIIDLTMGISSSAHIEYHCRILIEKYFARQMQNKCASTVIELYRDSTDVFDSLDGLRNTVQDLESLITSAKENVTTKLAHDKMLEIYKLNERPTVPITYSSLTRDLDGFHAGDFIVLGARPSIGKTAVGLNLAIKTAEQNIPTAIFCLEMSSIQMHQRTTANVCDVSFYQLNRKILNDKDVAKLYGPEAGNLEKMPLEYDETKNLSQMLSRIRVLANRGFKFFVIDYIQIITTHGMKFGSREQEIAFISRSLKSLALELKIVILALAQVGREVEKRSVKRPIIADLRESGALENDADIVCLLYRPEFYGITEWDDDRTPTDHEIELQFAKYRNGSPFVKKMKFWGDRMRLTDLGEITEVYQNPARTFNDPDGTKTDTDEDDFNY